MAMERSHIDESLGEGDEKLTSYRKPLKLWWPMERLNPEKRSRGLIFGAPTRALYDLWRRAQRWGK
jgi:hypothetical protein